METWLPVPMKGYSEIYEVSDRGRIRSKDQHVTYVNGVKHLHKGRILLPQKHKSGYRLVNLHLNKVMKTFLVHRIVAIAFVANPENLPQVNHKDFDKANNDTSNLEWVSAQQNTGHACENNRQFRPYGEHHSSSRLTQSQVDQIRELHGRGYSTYTLADMFGISRSHVQDVVSFRRWKKQPLTPV